MAGVWESVRCDLRSTGLDLAAVDLGVICVMEFYCFSSRGEYSDK